MRKIGVLLPAICLAVISLTAKADPTLTYNSGGPIGPYSLTETPGGMLSLFCLNDNQFIQTGESWTVAVILGSQLSTNSLTDGNTFKFEEEAYILSQFNGSNNTDVQEALWKIFDSSEDISGDPGAQALVTAAGIASNSFYTSGAFDSYVFYIYDGGTITNQYGDSAPQNFIGDPAPTPEPSTLMLLGTGLTALAGSARRKLVRC